MVWYVPSSSNRVAPLAKEEIKQKARSRRWKMFRGKVVFMMINMAGTSFRIWKQFQSVAYILKVKGKWSLRNEATRERDSLYIYWWWQRVKLRREKLAHRKREKIDHLMRSQLDLKSCCQLVLFLYPRQ